MKTGSMDRRGFLQLSAGLGALAVTGCSPTHRRPATDTTGEALRAVFFQPPAAARPRVWWHWLNGNVSKAGIEADLAWMERIGVGGVQNFEGSLDTPQVVDQRIPYLSAEWQQSLRHAVKIANQRGLEFTVASSPGWSETGGPWVRPEQAMKKLVWSEFDVTGGRPLAITLPQPPSVTGPFGDIPGNVSDHQGQSVIPNRFYRDSRVVAYRLPTAHSSPQPVVTTSSPVNIAALTDNSRDSVVQLPFEVGKNAWVQFAYDKPQTLRAATVALKTVPLGPLIPLMPIGSIQASEDGRHFHTIAELPTGGASQQTMAFPATTARFFRLVLDKGYAPLTLRGRSINWPAGDYHGVMEVDFLSAAHVHRFEDKAGFSNVAGLDDAKTPDADLSAVIATADVIDLTGQVAPDGKLEWAPPPGRWRILRLGWSLTGKQVHPASPEGTGLEVDKLNKKHVRDYAQAYLGTLQKAVGPQGLGKGGISHLLTDSYEAGASNWTDDILAQFRSRRGYDPLPFIPVLTGKVVQSAEASDRFLWDFRRTLADLVADAHYGELSRILKQHGMGRYGESHEAMRAFVGDGMEVKKSATVPMGAAWFSANPDRFMPDLLESASVAHLYGQNLVAAESFTVSSEPVFEKITPYGFAPEHLKPLADAMMANGVNRFVIHTSVHQPTDKPGPGVGLGIFGQWFTRKETWADMAGAWTHYLARSSAMLQLGRSVADIAWFYGEDDNITARYDSIPPAVPAGFAYDFVNADALRTLFDVKQGLLVTPSGAQYRILVVDSSVKRMTLPTLQKLHDLVEAGAVVVGQKPETTPSLADDETKFEQLSGDLWSSGKIYPTIQAAQEALALVPDATFKDAPSLAFVHRALPDIDVYYVANLSDVPVTTRARFRVAGRAPQIWRADDSTIHDSSFSSDDQTTEVPLILAARDALFIVFELPTQAKARQIPQRRISELVRLTGPWQLEFPQPGAPPMRMTMDTLVSWTHMPDRAIKYFSGTATYTTTFQLADVLRDGDRILIDLGTVKNIARISVNNEEAGIAWKAPFRVDITERVRTGQNTLTIAVANLWPNRIIGDKQPDATEKHAYMTLDAFNADSPLLPSGLLGPVSVLRDFE